MKTNISENLYDFASFQAGDLRGHMQSNIWENRGRLWWTESPPKSAQKSTRERSFFRRKVDKERGQKRNGIMWEKFPRGGPLPPS